MPARVVSWKFCENCGRHGNLDVPGLPPSPEVVAKVQGRLLLEAALEARFISSDEKESLLKDLEKSKVPEQASPIQLLTAILSFLEEDAAEARMRQAKLN